MNKSYIICLFAISITAIISYKYGQESILEGLAERGRQLKNEAINDTFYNMRVEGLKLEDDHDSTCMYFEPGFAYP